MNNRHDFQKEIDYLEAERRFKLRRVENLALFPNKARDVIASHKQEYFDDINKEIDDKIDRIKRQADWHRERKVSAKRRTSLTSLHEAEVRHAGGGAEAQDSLVDIEDISTTGDGDSDCGSIAEELTVVFDGESETVVSEEKHDYDLLVSRDPEKEQERIRKSKLTMAIQGFQSIARQKDESAVNSIKQNTTFDPEEVKCSGRLFRKGKCYRYKETIQGSVVNVLVGIRKFVSLQEAECILVVPFAETILGQQEDSIDYQADFELSTHFQVFETTSVLRLEHFSTEPQDAESIPEWVYEPQTVGTWNSFGYFLDNCIRTIKRKGKREEFRVLELFAGAGGMCLGFQNAGFVTVDAVDNDKYSIATLKHNCGMSTYLGDIRDYLVQHEDLESRKLQGRIDCVTATPPCQGFSGANRRGGQHDKRNNDLSLIWIDAVRLNRPTTVVFENVKGMWRRKHVSYLKNIAKELLKLDYQVRVAEMRACDYGSAQTRPRLIILATHRTAPPPKIPRKTHGSGRDQLPIVTVQDALSGLEDGLDSLGNPVRNTGHARTSLQAGEHGLVKLKADGLAPAIRASALPPLHYKYDRCISVRECAALQDFPSTYEFQGSLCQQYRQVGNAVPVELATKIAQAVREILVYNYED